MAHCHFLQRIGSVREKRRKERKKRGGEKRKRLKQTQKMENNEIG